MPTWATFFIVIGMGAGLIGVAIAMARAERPMKGHEHLERLTCLFVQEASGEARFLVKSYDDIDTGASIAVTAAALRRAADRLEAL